MTQLVKIAELSKQLSVSPSSIRREIDRGNLQAIKIGSSVRITSDEVERYIASLKQPQAV
jgi:excisionase family DNA binding protein